MKSISDKLIDDSMFIANLTSVTSEYIPKLHIEINYMFVSCLLLGNTNKRVCKDQKEHLQTINK
jgi:hypothetical protein